jgi:hypothetical protein
MRIRSHEEHEENRKTPYFGRCRAVTGRSTEIVLVCYRATTLANNRAMNVSLSRHELVQKRLKSTSAHPLSTSQPQDVIRRVFPATGFAIIPYLRNGQGRVLYKLGYGTTTHHPTYNKLNANYVVAMNTPA